MDKKSRIRGCLIGGAAGDALGYEVEFLDIDTIRRQFGEEGITEYSIDSLSNKAVVSDDTQMTLFTAAGLLCDETGTEPCRYVHLAYDNWYRTQMEKYQPKDQCQSEEGPLMWLMGIPELYKRRAPGNTCLSALSTDIWRDIDHPINHSKGCGGIMRVAPVGLAYPWYDMKNTVRQAAEIAAITHGHPLGFIPAGIFAGIIRGIVYGDPGQSLEDHIFAAAREAKAQFGDYADFAYLEQLITQSIELAKSSDGSDLENIRSLGEGWVAEETLAIAIYCTLKYQNDFSKGIIAAVNHSGDSDSTGAVAGNILGAWLGVEAIDRKWTDDLELIDVIEKIADDLERDVVK